MLNINKKIIILFTTILIFPIFLIPNNTWDSVIFDYAFTINDISGIEGWYKESRLDFQLQIIKIFFFINQKFNISHELIFDIFSSLALILYIYEIKRFQNILLGIENRWQTVCILIALTSPIWSVISSIVLGLYVFCFYLALLGYRFLINKKYLFKILGIIFIFFSLSIKSNLFLISGLALVHNTNLFFSDKSIQKKNIYILMLIFFIFIFIYKIFLKPYGVYSDYNQINFDNLQFSTIYNNFINFFSFFSSYFWIIGLLIIYLTINKKNNFKKIIFQKENINLLTISLFFLILITPYILVDKSGHIDMPEFKNRHALGVPIFFSLFFTLILKNAYKIFPQKNVATYLFILIIFQNLFYLTKGYVYKYEKSLINTEIIKSLKKIKEPKGGYIHFINDDYFFSSLVSSHIMFKAYNKAKWYGQGNKHFSINKNKAKNHLLMYMLKSENNALKKKYIITGLKEMCVVQIQFITKINKNEKLERIKKILSLSKRKYMLINSIKETC